MKEFKTFYELNEKELTTWQKSFQEAMRQKNISSPNELETNEEWKSFVDLVRKINGE